jgi:NAD(P)-dependent dehydrogenase (short-subunit alcohol dehydrogenase family)
MSARLEGKVLVDVVFDLTRAAWPQLKASSGVVVNMASVNALLSVKVVPSLSHTTNKAGIIGMTRQPAMRRTRARNPREHDLARLDRDQRIARAARGPRVGELHAR